ncbi:MAG: hypothetical protein L6R38_009167 [Xanthoria sp. 2 TBL-2021]|nr:MAG: hypothetical protein L6R38_009167 [Xanthoria sp. 2 TBL-2021]
MSMSPTQQSLPDEGNPCAFSLDEFRTSIRDLDPTRKLELSERRLTEALRALNNHDCIAANVYVVCTYLDELVAHDQSHCTAVLDCFARLKDSFSEAQISKARSKGEAYYRAYETTDLRLKACWRGRGLRQLTWLDNRPSRVCLDLLKDLADRTNNFETVSIEVEAEIDRRLAGTKSIVTRASPRDLREVLARLPDNQERAELKPTKSRTRIQPSRRHPVQPPTVNPAQLERLKETTPEIGRDRISSPSDDQGPSPTPSPSTKTQRSAMPSKVGQRQRSTRNQGVALLSYSNMADQHPPKIQKAKRKASPPEANKTPASKRNRTPAPTETVSLVQEGSTGVDDLTEDIPGDRTDIQSPSSTPCRAENPAKHLEKAVYSLEPQPVGRQATPLAASLLLQPRSTVHCSESSTDTPSHGCITPPESFDQTPEMTQHLPQSILHPDASSSDGGIDSALSSASLHMESETDDDPSTHRVVEDSEGLPNVAFTAHDISTDVYADGTLRLENRRLPTTDREGAVGTLRPGEWLSATAIELVLSMCFVQEVRVYHGFSLLQPSTSDRLGQPKIILLPIHHQSHWILAKVGVESRLITLYDFLSDALVGLAKQALLHFCTPLADDIASWSFIAVHSPTQTNDYDCGVFLLITALHILAGSDLPSSYNCSVWRTIFEAMLGGSNNAPTCQTSEETMEHHVNNPYSFLCLRELAQLYVQQAEFNISQLQEMTQELQEQIHTVRTRITCQQSAKGILQRLSDRSTSGLTYLCQGRDRIQSDIDVLGDMISRYGGVQLYLNETISDQLRQSWDEAARHLEHTTRWIGEAQGNIKRLGDAIGLINRTINEDQVGIETIVRETRKAVTALRDQQMTLVDRLDGLLDGALLKC